MNIFINRTGIRFLLFGLACLAVCIHPSEARAQDSMAAVVSDMSCSLSDETIDFTFTLTVDNAKDQSIRVALWPYNGTEEEWIFYAGLESESSYRDTENYVTSQEVVTAPYESTIWEQFVLSIPTNVLPSGTYAIYPYIEILLLDGTSIASYTFSDCLIYFDSTTVPTPTPTQTSTPTPASTPEDDNSIAAVVSNMTCSLSAETVNYTFTLRIDNAMHEPIRVALWPYNSLDAGLLSYTSFAFDSPYRDPDGYVTSQEVVTPLYDETIWEVYDLSIPTNVLPPGTYSFYPGTAIQMLDGTTIASYTFYDCLVYYDSTSFLPATPMVIFTPPSVLTPFPTFESLFPPIPLFTPWSSFTEFTVLDTNTPIPTSTPPATSTSPPPPPPTGDAMIQIWVALIGGLTTIIAAIITVAYRRK